MSLDKNELVLARLKDSIQKRHEKNIPSFFGFLNESEFSDCCNYLNKNNISYVFDGGYENSTRKILAFLPDWSENCQFPYKTIEITYNKRFQPTHRDFLGTFMSIGIQRSKIGDIIVTEGRAIVFVHDDIVDFLLEQIKKIGGVGVNIEIINNEQFNYIPDFEEIRKTITSARLDCVVSAIINSSRSKANELIISGCVFINQVERKNISFSLKNEDVITIRGYGKFIIDQINEFTKKGRLILNLRKFI